jgi:hypothetical protein
MKYRLLTTAVLLALCVLSGVLSVEAQSGRKHVKPEPAAPVPTPTPEPTPTPKKVEKESDLSFFIGADRNDFSANFPFTYYDAVILGCADRLRAGSSADVDISNQSLSRGEAIKRAKEGTDTYVVQLNLRLDSMARSNDDITVEFMVFAPKTGKVVTSGNAYLNSNRAGPISVPRGSSSVLYREQLLKLAGEDVGKRILKSLHLETPKIPN